MDASFAGGGAIGGAFGAPRKDVLVDVSLEANVPSERDRDEVGSGEGLLDSMITFGLAGNERSLTSSSSATSSMVTVLRLFVCTSSSSESSSGRLIVEPPERALESLDLPKPGGGRDRLAPLFRYRK